jgi:large subunit ribosomal protein L18
MSDKVKKIQNRASRLLRTRATIHGTDSRPRLSVHVSNQHISAQIINDDTHSTIVAASTVGSSLKGSMTDKASEIGTQIAQLAKKAKITTVVFDRGSKQYHGRIKALADAARKNGLEF